MLLAEKKASSTGHITQNRRLKITIVKTIRQRVR